MFNKNSFFNNVDLNKKDYNKNLSKTKNAFKKIKSDLKNYNLPQLDSYEKKYIYSFDSSIVKKFSKYNNIIIIGMGGSILGTKSIHTFFKKKIKKKVFFFDNLDSNLHLKFERVKKLKDKCFIVVSKSGNTLETIANFSIIFSKKLIKDKLIIITEIKDNNLMDIANKLNAEIIEHNIFVGGRYSVFSEVGMLPAKLMGLNIEKFKNLKKLINNKKFASSLIKNTATIYTLNKNNIKNSVILNYNSNLNDLCFWYQQLVAESLGKKGKGITPILSWTPKDHHSLLQLYLDGPKDKFFTFLSNSKVSIRNKICNEIIPDRMNFLKNKKLGNILNSQCEGTKKVFKVKKIPYRHFSFNKNNEEELGSIFTFFVLETILLARLMKVNPFDQPAVELIKSETKKILLR